MVRPWVLKFLRGKTDSKVMNEPIKRQMVHPCIQIVNTRQLGFWKPIRVPSLDWHWESHWHLPEMTKERKRKTNSLISSLLGNSQSDTPTANVVCGRFYKPCSQQSTNFKCDSSYWHKPNNAHPSPHRRMTLIPDIVISSKMDLKNLQILCIMSSYTCINFNMKRILSIPSPVNGDLFWGRFCALCLPLGLLYPWCYHFTWQWEGHRFKIPTFSKVVAFQ